MPEITSHSDLGMPVVMEKKNESFLIYHKIVDNFLEHRVELSSPLKIKPGQFPTVKVAFGTTNAIGAQGDMNDSAACDTGTAAIGLYGAAPDVTITFE